MARRLLATGVILLSALSLPLRAAPVQLPGNLAIPNVEYNPLLLINDSVQKELRLSPAVGSKVKNAFFQQAIKLAPYAMGGTAPNARPLSPQQRTAALYRGIEQMQASLAAMLTPPQRARLRQLTLQSIGPSAVLQPKVAAALGLSSTQRSRLEDALGEANAQVASNLQNSRTPQTMQRRLSDISRLQARAKATGNRVLATTLTAPQKARWRSMLGRPFELKGFLGAGDMSAIMGH